MTIQTKKMHSATAAARRRRWFAHGGLMDVVARKLRAATMTALVFLAVGTGFYVLALR